uniref:hypothetical protein n=1 Tax=uncultured Sphingorhabdus sp. TaxID=1686106 RepID=UPI00261643D7
LEMQVRAIMEAAVDLRRRKLKVVPEIMIPLSIDRKELGLLTDQTRRVAENVLEAAGVVPAQVAPVAVAARWV